MSDDDIIEKFYVDKRNAKMVTNSIILNHFKKMILLKNSGDLTNELQANIGFVYLLIGKKGIGKTILLKYFNKNCLENNNKSNQKKIFCIYLDLKNKKTDNTYLSNIPQSIIETIYDYIESDKTGMSYFLYKAEYIRKLHERFNSYSDDELTRLFFDKKALAIKYFFKYLNLQGTELVLIIDNIDDYSPKNIKKMIDYSLELKKDFKAKCIIAVRDYWTPTNLEIEDSNICALHLSEPNIREILLARLKKIHELNPTGKLKIVSYDGKDIHLSKQDVIDIFGIILDDLINKQGGIYRTILRLSNYDLREFLRLFYHFFHSPYLFSRPNFIEPLCKKIKEIDKDFYLDSKRNVRFFDFMECFLAPHSLCFDKDDSIIFNLFFHKYNYVDEGFNYKNTLIFYRILCIVPQSPSIISKDLIFLKLKSIGYSNDAAIVSAIGTLLNKNLLESPDGRCYEKANDLNLSAKGEIYKNILSKLFVYILFINDHVPMPKRYRENIHAKFGNEDIPLIRGDLEVKFSSVSKFITFILEEERNERENCPDESKQLLKEIIGDKALSTRIESDFNVTRDKMLKSKPRPDSIKFKKLCFPIEK
jgi:hypothetical protein